MTVAQMIDRLKTFDPNLPVALADWGESYRYSSEMDAEVMSVVEEELDAKEGRVKKKHLRIGNDI